MKVPEKCCKKFPIALEGPAKCIDITEDGIHLLRCRNGITHKISFCPFCGSSLECKESPEHEFTSTDQSVLERILGITSLISLCEVLGQPDEELEVEDGTAVQYSFNRVLQSGVIVAIDRGEMRLEILAIPHET